MSKGIVGKISCTDVRNIFESFYDLEEQGVEIKGVKVKPEIILLEDEKIGGYDFPLGPNLDKEYDEEGNVTEKYDYEDLVPVAIIKLPGILTPENGYYPNYDYGIVYRYPDGKHRIQYDISTTYDRVGATEEDAAAVRDELEGIINEALLDKNIETSWLNGKTTVISDTEDEKRIKGSTNLDDVRDNFHTFSTEEQEALRPLMVANGYLNI